MRAAVLALLLPAAAAFAQTPLNAPRGPVINAPAPSASAPADGASAPSARPVQAAPAVTAVAPGVYESLDIQGPVVRSFNMDTPRPELCAAACREDRQCAAWTYARPGAYNAGDPTLCVLKSRADRTSQNVRVTSGVLR